MKKSMNHENKHSASDILEKVVTIICYTYLPLICLILLMVVFSWSFLGSINLNVNEAKGIIQVIIAFSVPMIISLVILPLLFWVLIQHNTLQSLGLIYSPKKWSVVMCSGMGMIVLISTCYLTNNDEIKITAFTICFHFLVVAISEEIIMRGIIMHEISRVSSNGVIICVVNAVVFAFVFHSNEDFLSNLVVRLPLGLILSFSKLKSKDIYLPIMIHWAYDMGMLPTP